MSNNISDLSPEKEWEEATVELQLKRYYHGAIVLSDNNILITGGIGGRDLLDSTEVIKINNNTTASAIMPNLPSERSSHASVFINNDVYVIGGIVSITRLKSVQRINVINPQTGWQHVADMNQIRGVCAAAVHNGTIFVFGRGDENELSTVVEFFDTATNSSGEWNTIQSQMATPRGSHTAVTVGDIIYIIGGSDRNGHSLNSVEMFDTSSRTFQQGPPLPIPITFTSAVAVGKLIIVIGGYDTHDQRIGKSFVLDTTAKNPQWKLIDIELQSPRCCHTAVLMSNDKLCVCGGSGTGGELDTIETISIVDLLPQDLLDMTALHALCCDPNATVDTVRRLVEADPSALSHRDVTGRTPVQRFLLCRGLLEAGGENDNSNANDNDTEEEVEESLPSLYDLLENGTNGNDLDILFVLKKEFGAGLSIRDESTNLVPFMSAAAMSACGLDVVYSLAMGKPEVVKKAGGQESDSSTNKRRKTN